MKANNQQFQIRIITLFLTITRIAIGWQFLYEGISKLLTSGWSSAPYLAGSKWIFSPLFHWMAGSTGLTSVVDFLNIWDMIFVGLGLILGVFSRIASLGGAVMLLFYFVAYPPVPGYMSGVPAEGSYLWINRNLIEFFILISFSFITVENQYGLDRLYKRWKEEKVRKPIPGQVSEKEGAITPQVGLNYAFSNGADFVCLGMYDFQVVEDANYALEALGKSLERKRGWMA